MPHTPRVTFLFVDGIGLTDDPRSPLRTTALPVLSGLTGDFGAGAFDRPGLAYRVLDATLGIEGLPQSATGQTTLLTGVNAAALVGRHQGPHPGPRLQTLLAQQSLQVRVARGGLRIFHANGYRQDYLARVLGSPRNMLSAFAFAARAAGGSLLDLENARAHRPGYWTDPVAAGRALAQASEASHLTVFEYWALDYAGHREPEALASHLAGLDAFIGSYLETGASSTLVITSDHGNAEEVWHTHHTRNPVPFIAVGSQVDDVPPMGGLGYVCGYVASVLGLAPTAP